MSFKEARLYFCHKEAQNLSGFSNKDYLLHLYNPFINGGLTEALL